MSDVATAPDQGLVFYTDGGARNPFAKNPNPGYGGYGIHGYLYNIEKPKKGIGVSGTVATADGYKPRSETEELDGMPPLFTTVTPVTYIDACGALGPLVTNNYGELMGAVRALQEAGQYSVKKVHVISDSLEYLINGMNKYIDGWVKSNFMKPDGSERGNADTWRELVAARNNLTERGVEVKFTWIDAHNGHLGNEDADALATAGVMRSISGNRQEITERTPADGYWSYDPARNPLLFHRHLVFNTELTACKPGEYYTGYAGKDEDSFGIRLSDGCYGLVRLKEPDMTIEVVRARQSEVCSNTDHLAVMRLDNLFRPKTHREMGLHGVFAMERKDMIKYDLYCLDREPLTKVLTPARISGRMIEEIDSLAEKLKWYQADDERITVTDMTSILYETVVKTSKTGETTTHKVLKEMYNVGFAALRLDTNYKAVDGSVQAVPVTLNLGIDLPDRNALKRMEDSISEVTLISWKDSPTVFRYAVVVKTTGGVGIYAGTYSNIRIVEEKTA